jgi:hypothetical protein
VDDTVENWVAGDVSSTPGVYREGDGGCRKKQKAGDRKAPVVRPLARSDHEPKEMLRVAGLKVAGPVLVLVLTRRGRT